MPGWDAADRLDGSGASLLAGSKEISDAFVVDVLCHDPRAEHLADHQLILLVVDAVDGNDQTSAKHADHVLRISDHDRDVLLVLSRS